MGYGLWLILRFQPISKPYKLIEWLAGAVILHDGVLVPSTLLVGARADRGDPAPGPPLHPGRPHLMRAA